MGRNFKDLTDQKFGKLTVLEPLSKKGSHRTKVWKCLCDCGNITEVERAFLLKGHTKSCGCLRSELASKRFRKQFGKAAINSLFGRYNRNALKRGLIFNLSFEEFLNITKMPCEYCGILPNQVVYGKTYYGNYTFNGIDRLDNSKGYTIDNCVPCCSVCNYAKRKMSKIDFLDWIEKVYKFNFNKDNNE